MIFHRLSREDITRIVEVQVAMLTERVHERGIEIELTDDARTLLGNLGYDPTYGARPLKRVIQSQLVDRLALKLLEGEFAEGDTVRVEARDGDLVFEKTGTPVAGSQSTAHAAQGDLEAPIELADLPLVLAAAGHDDDLGRGVRPQDVLGRLDDVAVADPALGGDAGGGHRRQRDGQDPLALEPGRLEVVGPAVDRPAPRRREDEKPAIARLGAGRIADRGDRPRRSAGPRSARARGRGRRPVRPGPAPATSRMPSSRSATATTMIAARVTPAISTPAWTPRKTKPTNIGTTASAGTRGRQRGGIRLKPVRCRPRRPRARTRRARRPTAGPSAPAPSIPSSAARVAAQARNRPVKE